MKGSVRIAVARLGFEPKQEEPESSVLPYTIGQFGSAKIIQPDK